MKSLAGPRIFGRLWETPHRLPKAFYIPVVAEHLDGGRHASFVIGIKTHDLDATPGQPRECAEIKSYAKALQVSAEYFRRLPQPFAVSLRLGATAESLDRPAGTPTLVLEPSGHEMWEA